MKKQLVIAAGILLTLGTAVAATMSEETQEVRRATTVESASMDVGSQATAQVVSMWKTYANSAASAPLARPL